MDDIHAFCEENNIKYFISYGTLLGAIRHKGYIPWDDDIDICMPRPDYNRFIQLYNKRNSNYQMVAMETNDKYMLPFGKVEDTRTMMTETMYKQDDFGIYIDVFPLDGCDEKGSQIKKTLILTKMLNTKKAIVDNQRSFLNNLVILLGKMLLIFTSVKSILHRFDSICYEVSYDSAEYIATVVAAYGTFEAMRKELLEQTNLAEFEGRMYRIPKNYDIYLTQIYGNYMQLPPVEERVSHHTFKAWWK